MNIKFQTLVDKAEQSREANVADAINAAEAWLTCEEARTTW